MGKRDVLVENRHHNVPGSRGGSGKEINLSVIPERRHDQFHVWSWNRTPEMLIRKMILRAVGLEGGRVFPVSALEDVFGELKVNDWTDLYDPDAVIWLCGKGDREQVLKAEDYAVEHLIEELQDTRETINALCHGRYFPGSEYDEDEDFLQRALRFFGTNIPSEAVQRFLSETHRDHLLWVKPMQTTVRQKLLAILGSAPSVSLGRRDYSSLVDVLKNHELYLVSSIAHERSR